MRGFINFKLKIFISYLILPEVLRPGLQAYKQKR